MKFSKFISSYIIKKVGEKFMDLKSEYSLDPSDEEKFLKKLHYMLRESKLFETIIECTKFKEISESNSQIILDELYFSLGSY